MLLSEALAAMCIGVFTDFVFGVCGLSVSPDSSLRREMFKEDRRLAVPG